MRGLRGGGDSYVVELLGSRPEQETVQERYNRLRQEILQLSTDVQAIKVQRLYLQVAEQLRKLIAAGTFEVGQRLPSERDLAAQFGVSRPTITGVVDGLVRQKLVQRKPSASDRRQVTLTITEQGRTFMARLLPIQFKAMTDFVSVLTEAEQAQLVELLGKIEMGMRPVEEVRVGSN